MIDLRSEKKILIVDVVLLYFSDIFFFIQNVVSHELMSVVLPLNLAIVPKISFDKHRLLN